MQKKAKLLALLIILIYLGTFTGLWSTPRFGGYWVKHLETSTYFADGLPDGILWDGGFFPGVLENQKLFFRDSFFVSERRGYEKIWLHFKKQDLTSDPRLSRWWVLFCADDYKTLWDAVSASALTHEYPLITKRIISDMKTSGVLKKHERKLTMRDIKIAMLEYTSRRFPKIYEMYSRTALKGGSFYIVIFALMQCFLSYNLYTAHIFS